MQLLQIAKNTPQTFNGGGWLDSLKAHTHTHALAVEGDGMGRRVLAPRLTTSHTYYNRHSWNYMCKRGITNRTSSAAVYHYNTQPHGHVPVGKAATE